MSLIEVADPEGVRAVVLQSLEQYEIFPAASPGLLQRMTYRPDSFEFLHQCHCCGNHMMKVEGNSVFMDGGEGLVGPNNEIMSPGYHPVEDDWEAPAARFMAMCYDPRWLVARLDNLQVATNQQGVQLLRGEIPAEKLGIRIEPDRSLESLLGHFGEKKEGSEWARQEFLEGFRNPNTEYPPQEVLRFTAELEGLPEEDIPSWVRRFLQRPYILEVSLDDLHLPKKVTALRNGSLAPFPPDGMIFEYRPKNS